MSGISTSKKLLKSVAVDAKIPTMMIGDPGVGKSASVRALADELDCDVIVLLGSQLDQTDLTGLPQGRELGKTENGRTIYGTVNLSTYWQIKILTEKKVILFLDEYSNVPPAVRAGMLTLLQDREFANGQKMPDETIVIGAMNPPDESTDGYTLDHATKNRFFFMAWNPPAEEWYEGMQSAWGADVPKEELAWKQKIVRFIKDNPTYLHKKPDLEEAQPTNVFLSDSSEIEVFHSAWPSRRSWDNLSKALSFADESTYIQDEIAKGLVGHSAATQFRSWLRKHNTLNPAEVIEDPESVNWEKLSIDDSNL